MVVDLVVGDEALRLAELDQLVAHRAGAARAGRALALLGRAGLGLERGRIGLDRRGRALLRAAGQAIVAVVIVERRDRAVVVAEIDVHRLAGLGAGLAGTLRRAGLGLGRREVVVVLVAEAIVLVRGRAGRLHRLGLVRRLLGERRQHLARIALLDRRGLAARLLARGLRLGGCLHVGLPARLRRLRILRRSSGLLGSSFLDHD